MTVAELREVLSHLPDDAEVFTMAPDDGAHTLYATTTEVRVLAGFGHYPEEVLEMDPKEADRVWGYEGGGRRVLVLDGAR